jgi:formate dehydrogenase iron-sulfur subunit
MSRAGNTPAPRSERLALTLRAMDPSAPLLPPADAPVSRTLIDEFLAEQAETTAAERFASWHHDAPARTSAYRDLLPATPPAPGQQYAFEVDLDACSGCEACVVACGRLNGLEEGRSFRSTGEVVGASGGGPDGDEPVRRTVTTACHHCEDPGCLTGCPADAYEKDPVTGVVRHLDDQCIGCRYCTLTCPYDVPSFDGSRGIVRKCDLCHDRLAVGEAPACVQACPTQAIAIRIVDLDTVGAPGPWPFPAPDPATTSPTTVYRGSEDLRSGAVALADGALHLDHAHPPLTVMLVLTQLAVGTLVALLALASTAAGGTIDLASGPIAATTLGTAVVALGASVLHLGRPLQAWRAVLGFRHSWLSREIVAFGLFAPLAAATAAGHLGASVAGDHVAWLGPLTALVGLVGVATSVLVYAVTGRRWWSWPRVAARFGLTTALTGAATAAAVAAVTAAAVGADAGPVLVRVAVLTSALVVAAVLSELLLLRHRSGPADDELARTARLLHRRLLVLVQLRLLLLVAGGILAPWFAVLVLRDAVRPSSTGAAVVAVVAAVLVVGAELIERWRFFTAVAPVRMPGRPA